MDENEEPKKVWNRRSKKSVEQNQSSRELEIFSKNLKRYRQIKCLSLFQLEKLSEVSVNVIYEIENQLSSPSFKTIIKLSKAFNIHPSIMFISFEEDYDLIQIINDYFSNRSVFKTIPNSKLTTKIIDDLRFI